MAVERIDKSDRLDYWKVQSSSETHKDKEQGQEEGKRDAFAALSEKTDWQNLFEDKTQAWNRNVQVMQEEIDQIIFIKINLKTDPSLLRVDVELKGGETISPAFLAISRAVGLKIKNLKPGEAIPEEYILQNNILRIIVPTNPKLFRERENQAARKTKAPPKKVAESTEATEATVKHKKAAGWSKTLALKDPKTNQIRLEILAGYGIAFLVLLLLIGGFLILS